METLNFREIINDSPLWIKNKYLDYKRNIPTNIINILLSFYNTFEDLQTKSVNEVYTQSFIITATGEDLDKLGQEFLIYRNGESDDDYRLRIISYNSMVSNGAITYTLKQFLGSLGLNITNLYRLYTSSYNPLLGGNGDGEIGDLLFTITESPFRNFLTFIEVDNNLTDEEILYYEYLILTITKVNNYVYIRNKIES